MIRSENIIAKPTIHTPMKKNSLLIPAATLLFAGMISLCTAQSSRINPATGQPVAPGAGTPSLDPITGLINPPEPNPYLKAMRIQNDSLMQVRNLITSGDYEEALKECLAFQSQLKGDKTLEPLIPDWVELGRRYAPAKDELLKIRDHDVAEFSAGRGYVVLFHEIKAINAAWNEENATEALFKSLRSQDSQLAGQCYGDMQDWLVQKGEYAFCLECIGDPRSKFEDILSGFQLQVALQQQQTEMRQIMEEQNERFNRPTMPPFVPTGQGRSATNNFVRQVITLEKILAGAGRQADAEIIRDQALAVVADDRFRSAGADTEPKTRK